MKTATEKLLKALMPISDCKEGELLTNEDGEKYRYDLYKTKYPTTKYWLRLLFENAAKENGKQHDNRFSTGEWSFFFERAKFKGQPDGRITFTRLVVLN